MPIMAKGPGPGRITTMLPAFDGLYVQVEAPAGADTTGIPGGGPVVGWAVIDTPGHTGGARIDPVFLADGQAWTPDQYRATYGLLLEIRVERGR